MDEPQEGCELELVRTILLAMEFPSPTLPAGRAFEPGFSSPELERCLDRLRDLGLIEAGPAIFSKGTSLAGGIYGFSYRPTPAARPWHLAARSDVSWAAAIGKLDDLLQTGEVR